MAPLVDLTGKVALVTGAGSGIGRETMRQLHALGASVIATDLDGAAVADAAAAIDPAIATHAHDVGEEADWTRIMAAVDGAHARLDVLVNNAGIMLSHPFADAGIDVLRRQHRVNVEGVYLGMRAALAPMERARAAGAATTSIVNISSVYGMVAGAQFAAYSATKGAVRALSKAVAFELAATGIRVNTILPGPVATALGASWDPPRDATGRALTPEEGLARWLALMPMGRMGAVTDIAPMVAFLASDAACFVTGAEFVVDGGYTAP
jgi:NAD(P)-dependent dehydrogenase (short-subunit alcohol dehydrogenase family)